MSAGTSDRARVVDELQINPRRLAFEDLVYKGGFRLPAERSNDDSIAGGGQALAFNPAKPSLFVSSYSGRVAEVSIPTPAVNGDAKALPVAAFLQGFSDPTGGRQSQVASWGIIMNSLVVSGGRLYGTAFMYYDPSAPPEQRVSHYSRSLQLNDGSFSGWSQVWENGKAGFVAGLLAAVPTEWQQRLGGSMLSGQCCIPIISRTSWGPAAFAFDQSAIGNPSVAATALAYYNEAHPTLGTWPNDGKLIFNQSTEVSGLVIVAGTRTALYFGRIGIGPTCYGPGVNDPKLHGLPVPPSGTFKYCYDPTSADQGIHAYPFRYQVWAYDLNDFAAVKAGAKKPWEVVPYGVWPLTFPTPEPRTIIGGVSYDAVNQTIYVAQRYADRDEYESRPVIHTFKIQ